MRTLSSALIALVLLASAGSASAQEHGIGVASDDGHFDVKLMLGLGGEVELEGDFGFVDYSAEDDLELSYGLGLAYLHPLHRYFAIGAQLSFSSWIGDEWEDADLDRNLFIDLSLLPQGRYAINSDVEIYLTIPLGLTYSGVGEDDINIPGGTAGVDDAIGFHIGVMLGARIAISSGFGLLAELGYVAHAATHEAEFAGATDDLDMSHGQFALNLGVWF